MEMSPLPWRRSAGFETAPPVRSNGWRRLACFFLWHSITSIWEEHTCSKRPGKSCRRRRTKSATQTRLRHCSTRRRTSWSGPSASFGRRESRTNCPTVFSRVRRFDRVRGRFDDSERDLNEVMKIAHRGRMKLHEADAHLEFVQLYIARGQLEGGAAEPGPSGAAHQAYQLRPPDVVAVAIESGFIN